MDERERNGANMGYEKNGPVSGIKQKIIQAIFKELGIKGNAYDHGFQRGVYFAQMYQNGNDFLCSKIEETDLVLNEKFAKGNEYTIKWWKDKAIKRYTKLHEEGRIKYRSSNDSRLFPVHRDAITHDAMEYLSEQDAWEPLDGDGTESNTNSYLGRGKKF